MRKLLLVLLLWHVQSLQAQSLKSIGIEAGINKEFTHLGKYEALDNKISIAPSLLAELDFGKRILLRTGINYFRGGFSYNSRTNANIPINVLTPIHTLNIPVLASLPLPIHNNVQLYINSGVNFYLATSGKIIETGYWTPYTNVLYVKTRDVVFGSDTTQFKRLSYALHFGLGLRVANRVELNMNYMHGLSNYTNSSVKNTRKNISLGIIYFFYRKAEE